MKTQQEVCTVPFVRACVFACACAGMCAVVHTALSLSQTLFLCLYLCASMNLVRPDSSPPPLAGCAPRATIGSKKVTPCVWRCTLNTLLRHASCTCVACGDAATPSPAL